MKQKYYVVETNWVRAGERFDVNTITICKTPAIYNISKTPCIEGFAGTTDGWSVYGHGEFESIDAARKYIESHWGHVRTGDANGDFIDAYKESFDVVDCYKPGEFAEMTSEMTREYVYEALAIDGWPDLRGDAFCDYMEGLQLRANADGMKLHLNAADYAFKVLSQRRIDGK